MALRALKLAEPSDATLVERVRRGDESAFNSLYNRHARYVAGVVFRLIGTDGDLDDIVQETFVDAMQQLRQLRDPERVRSWLVTIAVRRSHRVLRARRRRMWFGLRVAEVSAPCGDPRTRRLADDLYDALDRLSPRIRVPWVLHRIEDETLPEVARICDISLATAKRRIADADERLNRRLHGTG